VRNCGAKHPHRNCGVRFRTQCHARPQTQRAVQRRTQLAAERVSQAGTRCATRRPVHCQVEKGVDVLTDSGAELPSLGAIGRRAEPRTRRAADCRAKSLIDGHIDGRIVLGVEPRSHPRIDPPVARSSASSGLGPSAIDPVHRPYPADVFQQGPRLAVQTFPHRLRSHTQLLSCRLHAYICRSRQNGHTPGGFHPGGWSGGGYVDGYFERFVGRCVAE